MHESRLTGQALTVARTVWVISTLVLAGLYVASIPSYIHEYAVAPTSNIIPVNDPNQMLLILKAANISPTLYVAIQFMSRILWSLPFILLGTLLFLRKSSDLRILLMSFLFILVGTDGGGIGTTPGNPQTFFQGLKLLLEVLGAISIPILFYTFPDGKFVPRWTKWAAIFSIPIIALSTFFSKTSLDPFTYPLIFGLYGLISLGSFLIAPVYRYFRVADTVQRQQLKWALTGIIATPLTWLFYAGLVTIFPTYGQPNIFGLRFEIAYYFWSIPLFLLAPLGISFSILRFRLFDIDLIIRRTLQYTLLTGLLALTYFGGVVLLQSGFRTLTGQTNSPLITVLSTLSIAALFTPLRIRVQDFIDRRFYRKKYNAERALAQFAATARDEVDMVKLTTALIGVVEETMRPEKISLWVKDFSAKPPRQREAKEQ